MTRNPDVPDRWPAAKPSQPNLPGQIPGSPQVPSSSAPKRPTARPVSGIPPQREAKPAHLTDAVRQQAGQPVGEARGTNLVSGIVETSTQEVSIDAPDPSPLKPLSGRFRFMTKWPFLAAVTVIISGSMGFMAIALLFKLPAVPNCPATFWPTASASLRLYCAQLAANKQTANNLLEAISLVNSLPNDHPLRPEINRHIEKWSLDILKLGEQDFQAGKLEEAIALARKIPAGVPAYGLVEKRIERWQTIWSEAEEIYQKVNQLLHQSNWHQAFMEAVRLTRVGNTYWAQNKYEELVTQIQTAREESAKLDKAYQLAKSGELDNLLEAIKLAQAIGPNSYARKEAQDLISDCGNKLLNLAQERLDKQDWQSVLQIAKKVPPILNLQATFQDFIDLANAGESAKVGTVSSLEQAIAQAQKIEVGRPLHNKAQDYIARWQLEIEDVAHLGRARDLAKPGSVNDLMAAIAEAQLINRKNPRFEEAQAQINRWTNQIETVQDRPYLDRAEQLASLGDAVSLQDAIEQANQIVKGRALYQEAHRKIEQWTNKIQRLQDQPLIDESESLATSGNLSGAVAAAQKIRPGRVLYQEAQRKIRQWAVQIERQEDQPYLNQAQVLAESGNLSGAIAAAQQIRSGRVLYGEAQRKIRSWRGQIERQEDQPYLDQAQTLADAGNLSGAIATAQQIRSGRALYDDARAKIRVWQREVQAQQRLNSAFELAKPGTPEALALAIREARQVPASSSVGGTAREARNRWSYQLLEMASERAASNTLEAIAIAKSIPSGTDAYESAQLQIQAWQNSLQPPSGSNN